MEKKQPNRTSDHMANERTFLAWIRTSIGVMAFGFVVERFSFLLNKATHLLTNESEKTLQPNSFFGMGLVLFGGLLGIFALFQYRKAGRQIEKGAYHPSSLLATALTFIIVASAIFLLIYV